MRFGWSDELAELLIAEDQVPPSELASWISSPTAYRLPEESTDLDFARDLRSAADRRGKYPFGELRAS